MWYYRTPQEERIPGMPVGPVQDQVGLLLVYQQGQGFFVPEKEASAGSSRTVTKNAGMFSMHFLNEVLSVGQSTGTCR